MKIYLWRHGDAEKDSITGKDEDRALSPEGRNDVIDVADFVFGKEGVEKPEKIFTSPLLRAKESAEMIQGFLGCPHGLMILPELKSGTSTAELVGALKKSVAGLRSLILVGHVPDLEQLAIALVTQAKESFALKTGGLIEIEIPRLEEPFQGKLVSSINPAALPSR